MTGLDRLRNGVNTVISGMEALSGGEAQRIFLARILYKRPEIVLVDEGTSALDPILETTIMTALRELTQHGTLVIMSAHRTSTILAADQIVLLEHGKISAQGTPEEMRGSGPFQRFMVQTSPAPT
jgi:ATP-binding cassette subfamily B protein